MAAAYVAALIFTIMNQNIRYKGLSLTPDELSAPVGSLAVSANAELHNGALRPSVIVGTAIEHDLEVPNSNPQVIATLFYIHKTSAYTHFIAGTNQVLYWYYEDGTYVTSPANASRIVDLGTGVTVIKIENIGNTLVIMATNGIHYALWKSGSGSYVYLGQKPPFIKLTFGLTSIQRENYDRSTVQHDGTDSYAVYNALYNTGVNVSDTEIAFSNTKVLIKTEEARTKITEGVWALVNMAHDVITKNGHFYAPFLVRYCYRMYDNTMIMHSAPIFMPIAYPHPFFVRLMNYTCNDDRTAVTGSVSGDTTITEDYGVVYNINKITALYRPHSVGLKYKLESDADYQGLQQWSDIIKSIDVFISPQFLRTDSSKIIETASPQPQNHIFVGDTEMSEGSFGIGQRANFDIPELSDEAFLLKIANWSEFFLLHSFNLDEQFSLTFTDFPVNPTKLLNLTTAEQMVDDYKSHNLLFPSDSISGLYVYNRRLNAYGLSEKLFQGFLPAYGQMPYHTESNSENKITVNSVYVILETDDGQKIVKTEYQTGVDVSIWMLCHSLLFYPDSRAVKMIINVTSGNDAKHIELPMTTHNSLNGAIVTSVWDKNTLTLLDNAYSGTLADSVHMPNKIYTSKVNNPYHFPPNSINTVGTGTILAISANTRALSSGTEIGKFGLLAFATDGIWVMDVSAEGTYSAIHNINREVCSNPDSVCQLDQQVIFATDRGLSVATEQNSESISDMLFGSLGAGITATTFPDLFAYFADATGDSETVQNIKAVMRRLLAFISSPITFFQTARVIYDFINSRLILMSKTPDSVNDDLQCVMIYSISDGSWSTATMPKTLTALNSYPYPYIQDTDGTVFCLNKKYPYNETQPVQGNTIDGSLPTLILTRAMSFGDGMYCINDFIHNKIHDGKTVMFIFGSNNLRSWHYIGRTNQEHAHYLPTLSYRYLRLALYSVMKPDEQYISTSLNIKEKFPKI